MVDSRGDKLRKNIINLIGAIVLFVGILGIFNSFYFDRAYDLFWFCYLGSILLGIGIIFRNITLIKSQFYILIIPDIIWSIDFLVHLIRGKSIFGIVDYFFVETRWIVKIVSLQHIYSIPLVILAVFLIGKAIKTENRALLMSFIQITFTYLATTIFTPPEANINCAYRLCGSIVLSPNYYPLLWFAASLIMLFLTRSLVNKILQSFIKDNH